MNVGYACYFCENHQGPYGKDDDKYHKCNTCDITSNFELKHKMSNEMRREYFMNFSKSQLVEKIVKTYEILDRIEDKVDGLIELLGGEEE